MKEATEIFPVSRLRGSLSDPQELFFFLFFFFCSTKHSKFIHVETERQTI